jgi:hypothetical protein
LPFDPPIVRFIIRSRLSGRDEREVSFGLALPTRACHINAL